MKAYEYESFILEEPTSKLGSIERYRSSNEALYNIKHTGKMNLRDQSAPTLVRYQRYADAITRARREHFDRVKAVELSKPRELRMPHYFDDNGFIKAYTVEEIEGVLSAQNMNSLGNNGEGT
jgi:hypothetical protein